MTIIPSFQVYLALCALENVSRGAKLNNEFTKYTLLRFTESVGRFSICSRRLLLLDASPLMATVITAAKHSSNGRH